MVKRKKNIAIIPARGGSKRIPKKNIIDFFGKPMIARTIDAAKKSNIFDKIMVSTDNKEIADISQEYGAHVPFLRKNYNDDYATVSDAIIYSLKELKDKLSKEYETVTLLMANCPLRNNFDIIKAHTNFTKLEATFQISCFKFGWMNPWWASKLNNKSEPVSVFPQAFKQRSQDLEELYCPTGAIWIAKTKDLLQQKSFYGKPLKYFPLDWKSAIDIDNYEDLEMAKALFLLQNNSFYNFNNMKNISIF